MRYVVPAAAASTVDLTNVSEYLSKVGAVPMVSEIEWSRLERCTYVFSVDSRRDA